MSGVGPGLGRQAARALAAHGADLVLAARRQSTLDDVLAEVSGLGARAITVPTDITDPEACARLMAAGAEEFGGIDVLVNNAFRFDAFQSFEDVDLAIWRKIMDTNLFGSLQMTRAALPSMRDARRRLGRDGGVDGGAPAPAGAGWLRHLQGGAADGHPGARLRAGPVERPGERRRPGLDGRARRSTSTST